MFLQEPSVRVGTLQRENSTTGYGTGQDPAGRPTSHVICLLLTFAGLQELLDCLSFNLLLLSRTTNSLPVPS